MPEVADDIEDLSAEVARRIREKLEWMQKDLMWQSDDLKSIGVFGADQTLKSKVLPKLNLSVVQIFEGA